MSVYSCASMQSDFDVDNVVPLGANGERRDTFDRAGRGRCGVMSLSIISPNQEASGSGEPFSVRQDTSRRHISYATRALNKPFRAGALFLSFSAFKFKVLDTSNFALARRSRGSSAADVRSLSSSVVQMH